MDTIDSIETNSSEVSMTEIMRVIKSMIYHLISNWWKIALVFIICFYVGYYFASKKPIQYTAKLSFIVEEGKSGTSGLALLAGQFGMDVGGTQSSGLLYGENLLMYLKSESLLREVLLSRYDSSNDTYSLADKYADVFNLRKQWLDNINIGKNINFPPSLSVRSTRLQDSILQTITNDILKNKLVVERPEKKATFIVVRTTLGDEMLAKVICERIVSIAIDRYIATKTARQKKNVDRLQMRADSIGRLLNYKTFTNAVINDKLLDINPAFRSSTVNAEVSGRDKAMISAIYSEVIKNLEMSKVQLSLETPTIQVVDNVLLPLPIIKKSKLITGLFMGLIATLLFSFLLLAIKILKK